eukprot:364408-Chlamydomonas_euryale.AAC.8
MRRYCAPYAAAIPGDKPDKPGVSPAPPGVLCIGDIAMRRRASAASMPAPNRPQAGDGSIDGPSGWSMSTVDTRERHRASSSTSISGSTGSPRYDPSDMSDDMRGPARYGPPPPPYAVLPYGV